MERMTQFDHGFLHPGWLKIITILSIGCSMIRPRTTFEFKKMHLGFVRLLEVTLSHMHGHEAA